jgi:hypothetical protein
MWHFKSFRYSLTVTEGQRSFAKTRGCGTKKLKAKVEAEVEVKVRLRSALVKESFF